MRPRCRMPISSAIANASCWSCVTSTAVAPLALMMSRTSSDSRSRRSTSRLENGSSSSSSSGRGASARASATLIAERAVLPDRGVGGHREMREQRVVLEHHADAPPLGRQHHARAGNDLAGEADLAFANAFEARYAAQHRGLAAAARPEQAADGAAREREGQAAHHFLLAVGMAKVFDLEEHAR